MKLVNRQFALRPQDLVVILKAHLIKVKGQPSTYAGVAKDLCISASEVHGSFKRAQAAKLVGPSENGVPSPISPALKEFLIYGAKYAFPPVLGPMARGIPTAYGAEPMRGALVHAEDAPVWPFSDGQARGQALYPLYPTAPLAASRDPALYEVLALFDAVRIGSARERDLAVKFLNQRLS